MSIGTNDPHAMKRRLYAIDVALVGEDEAPERWKIRFVGNAAFDPAYRYKHVISSCLEGNSRAELRRDPGAPALPSWDWHEAPIWSHKRAYDDAGKTQWAGSMAPIPRSWNGIEDRPPKAWFDATADMTRAEYEVLQRLARGEAGEPDSEKKRYENTARNRLINQAVIDLDALINNHDPQTDTSLDNSVWDRLDQLLLAAENHDACRVIEPASDEPADDGVLSGAEAKKMLANAILNDEQPDSFETIGSQGCYSAEAWWQLWVRIEKGRHRIRRKPATPELTIDGLSQEIRRVDGSHSLGAGALAEALMPYLIAASTAGVTDV